ncbi:MAG: cobyrinate a,c-diamide synthase, partial [Nitrospirota bacterium]|nr:cobyrinate a,c-diamide synthase [Nitrospirota bacterium]
GGVKIGLAYDRAFCFYYEDNLDLLRQEGAEIVRFSPLTDSALPDNIDALYLGGGYPELYAAQLSGNRSMIDSIRGFADGGGPVYAECGGFMYLTQGIYDTENSYHPMAGVFPFRTRMMKGRARLGYREAVLKEDCMLGKEGDAVRGHEFHYSEIVDSAEARKLVSAEVYSVRDGEGVHIYDEGFRVKNTFGSYIHVHFGSNQLTAKNIIGFIREKYGKNSNCGTR